MDPFSTLGLPRRYEIDLRELESRYRELQKALHPDRHAGASASQRRMSMLKAVEVNDAYRALKDDLRRAEALLALYEFDGVSKSEPPEDPEFLMQMLELREALAEAKESNHAERMQGLRVQVEGMQRDARARLIAEFAALPEPPRAPAPGSGTASALRGGAMSGELSTVRRAIGRLKYFKRFLDEVSALHDEGIG